MLFKSEPEVFSDDLILEFYPNPVSKVDVTVGKAPGNKAIGIDDYRRGPQQANARNIRRLL